MLDHILLQFSLRSWVVGFHKWHWCVMSVHSEVAWLHHIVLLMALVSRDLSRARLSSESSGSNVGLWANELATASLVLLSTHDVWKDLRLRDEITLHCLIVVDISRHYLIHKVVVLSGDLLRERHTASIRAWSSDVTSVWIASTQSSYSSLSIHSISTLSDHLVTNSSSHIWACSMWEKNFVNFQQSSLIVNEQIKKVISILARKLTNLYPILGQLC